MLVAVGLVVALAAAAFVFLFSSGPGQQPAIALQFVEGESMRYRMSMELRGRIAAPGMEEQGVIVAMDATVGMDVVSVDSSGVADVDVSLDRMQVRVNGRRVQVPAQGGRMRLAPDGRILEGGFLSDSVSSSGAGVPGLDQFAPILPEGEVAAGDTWSKEFAVPVPFGDGGITLRTTNTLLRYQKVGGQRAAVVVSHIDAPFDFNVPLSELSEFVGEGGPTEGVVAYDGSMVLDMTATVGTADGTMIDSETDGTFEIRMSFHGTPGIPEGEQATFNGSFSLDVKLLAAPKAAEPAPAGNAGKDKASPKAKGKPSPSTD